MKRWIAALCCAAAMAVFCVPGALAYAVAVPAMAEPNQASLDKESIEAQEKAAAEEARHHDPNVSLTVRYDYDNAIRTGVAVPAFVTIDNRGDAFSATLQLYIFSQSGGESICYELPVEVAANASSQFTLPFSCPASNMQLYLRLARADGTAIGGSRTSYGFPLTTSDQGKLQEMGFNNARFSTEMLVGILTNNPESMGYLLDSITLQDASGENSRAKGVELSPGNFPELYYYMDRFALIVLNHFDVQRLNAGQQKILFDWLRQGGSLLLDGDPAGADALLALSPVLSLTSTGSASPAGARQALQDHFHWNPNTDEGLATEFAALGKVEPAGNALASLESTPLISEYSVERGRVFVTTFALSDPVMQLRGARQILSMVNGMSALPGQNQNTGMGYSPMVGSEDAAVQGIAWMDAPSITWMIGMLVAFIAVAGPVSYVILAKKDKRDLIWITAPALALVCCAVIAIFGINQRGNQPVSSVVSVVDRRSQSHIPAYTTVGLGAPKKTAYDIRFQEEALPLTSGMNMGYDMYYSSYAPAPSPGDVSTAEPSVVYGVGGYPNARFREIPQWDMQSMVLRRDLPLEGSLEAAITYSADGLEYWIRNGTGLDLEDVTLAHNKGYVRLPLLESGEEARGELTTYKSLQAGGGYGPVMMDFWSICNELYGGPAGSHFGPDPAPEDDRSEEQKREDYIKGSLVQSQLQRTAIYDPYTGRTSINAVWAWSTELGQLEMTANGQAVRNDMNLALLMEDSQINFESGGRFTIPEWEIFGKISYVKDVEGSAMLGAQNAYLTRGEVIFDIALPERMAHYDVDKLTVHSTYIYGNYDCQLYNFSTGTWDAYTVNKAISGDIAADYIAPWQEEKPELPEAQTAGTVQGDQPPATPPEDAAEALPDIGDASAPKDPTAGTDYAQPTDADRAPEEGNGETAQPGCVRIRFIVKDANNQAEGVEDSMAAMDQAAYGNELSVDSLSISVSGKEKANAGN